MTSAIKKWGIFEERWIGSEVENPFTDVKFSAVFRGEYCRREVDGFYDGNGTYVIRFMPDSEGEWTFETRSNLPELNGKTGRFLCTPKSDGNHGVMRVKDTFHFAYDDGTRYYPFGTTCYAWLYQSAELQEQTLQTLKENSFNKIRMCLFPKFMIFNTRDPEIWPFEHSSDGNLDYLRPNPEWYRLVEKQLSRLAELGIEADIILFHPYDKTECGFSKMTAQQDDNYLKYAVSRLSHFHNVWWSVANEYDLIVKRLPVSPIQEHKEDTDFDRFFHIIQRFDPYQHLRSIHQCYRMYDHGKPWVTHCSIQHHMVENIPQWREQYQKPVIDDECNYEGDINWGWGNLTGEELVRRFWQAVVSGGYATHGETFCHPKDILWWAHGGILHGESQSRIAFLRKVIEENPNIEIQPITWRFDISCGGEKGKYYLFYLGIHRPRYYDFDMEADEQKYYVDVIDTWDMTMKRLDGVYSKSFIVDLPGKQYMAIRLTKAEDKG